MIQIDIKTKPLRVSEAWQGRRFKTSKYKKWAEEVTLLIASNLSKKSTKRIEGPIEVTVELFLKNVKRSDVDNFLKTLFDTITACEVWEDDNRIYALHVYKEYSEEEWTRVTIVPFE